jgi:glycosyltransferase involved in cell wall biosynthesis
MTEPFVSVLIVGRNVGAYVRETVESALGQTWQRREVIVVDDGSVDDTPEILKSFGTGFDCSSAPGGLAAGRTPPCVAEGEYIALLDADDLWHPDNLEVRVAVARRHPESGLVACDGVEFGQARFGPTCCRQHSASGSIRPADANTPAVASCSSTSHHSPARHKS